MISIFIQRKNEVVTEMLMKHMYINYLEVSYTMYVCFLIIVVIFSAVKLLIILIVYIYLKL